MRDTPNGSFIDPRDSFSYSSGNQSTASLTMDGSFDSSFSSSASICPSWDIISPPPSSSRRESCGSFDLNDQGLSSSRTSNAGSPGHVEDYFTLNSMPSNMLTGIQDQGILYSTPCSKSFMAPNMMTYDFQYANTMYSPLEPQEYMNETGGLKFETTSPLVMTPTSAHYVVPSQTYFQSFEPSTPLKTPGRTLGSSPSASSPLADYSAGFLQHFMTPPHGSQSSESSAHSARSSFSLSSPSRASSTQTLERCSAALHRVQSGSRIKKQHQKPRIFPMDFVAKGQYICQFPGCDSKHAFKRQEHLKRHMKTHTGGKPLNCKYCHKTFQLDRSDNYRSHVRLHTHPDKKGSRTKFFREAVAEVASWDKQRGRSERTLAAAANINSRASLRRNKV